MYDTILTERAENTRRKENYEFINKNGTEINFESTLGHMYGHNFVEPGNCAIVTV